MIWVTSDFHFNHSRILSMDRDFKTIEEHNEYLIQQYNSVVDKDDLVYILGDIGFQPLDKIKPLVQRLNGRKILILGNHDKGSVGEYKAMGFIEVYDHPIYYSSKVILSHEPVKEAYDNPYVMNVHGHLHQSILSYDNFLNANCELHNYKPLDLREIDRVANIKYKKRREAFKYEWYYEGYQWIKDIKDK